VILADALELAYPYSAWAGVIALLLLVVLTRV
jgi:hypothetical protein